MQQNATVAKDKTFNLRLDEHDRARLEALCEHFGVPSAATVMRMLVKAKYDELYPPRPVVRNPDETPTEFLIRKADEMTSNPTTKLKAKADEITRARKR